MVSSSIARENPADGSSPPSVNLYKHVLSSIDLACALRPNIQQRLRMQQIPFFDRRQLSKGCGRQPTCSQTTRQVSDVRQRGARQGHVRRQACSYQSAKSRADPLGEDAFSLVVL